MASRTLDELIDMLARLPGLGPRSAKRTALYLLKHRDTAMQRLSATLAKAADEVRQCSVCGNLDDVDPCTICDDDRRDGTLICVVEAVDDLWAVERAGFFKGRYHVLGGTLSAIDGIGPEDLGVDRLLGRIGPEVDEVILATSATVDGQTNGNYLAERLVSFDLTVTRLAHGVPVGGELNYLDDGTLGAALKARRPVEPSGDEV
ncbi:MAG: recombination mediator RecR [Geminicoccaceae bacterium]